MMTMCQDQRAWDKLTPIQSILTLSISLGAPVRMFPQYDQEATLSQVD